MRVKTRDDRVGDRLPPAPEPELNLYHWSPTRNRRSIERQGLVPGRLSLQGDWRPPYVAFADDPILGWALSGRMWPSIPEWDLWMVSAEHQTSVKGWEVILDTYASTGRHYIKEYRVYGRIFKRDLWYVASRTHD